MELDFEKLNSIYEKVKKAYLLTRKKYDDEQAKAALKDLIQKGNLNKFTNDSHVRDSLYKISCTKTELIYALVHTNITNLSDSNVNKIVDKFHFEVVENNY